MIRVALADDQALIRAGFHVLIDAADDMTVVGEANDGATLLTLLHTTPADVVLMDIRMPGIDGLEATRRIAADDSLRDVRVIVLTTFEIDDYAIEAVLAGASGFIGKGVEPSQLLDAIRVVHSGEALLSPKATVAVLNRFADGGSTPAPSPDANELDSLTAREREVMALAAQGLGNDEIAEQLFISTLTAKTHVNRAMMKLGARDRAQLVVAAYRTGLVAPGS